MSLGEYPEFTDDEKAILRGYIAGDWHRLHREKNAEADRAVRDSLTVQLNRLEQLGEKVGQL